MRSPGRPRAPSAPGRCRHGGELGGCHDLRLQRQNRRRGRRACGGAGHRSLRRPADEARSRTAAHGEATRATLTPSRRPVPRGCEGRGRVTDLDPLGDFDEQQHITPHGAQVSKVPDVPPALEFQGAIRAPECDPRTRPTRPNWPRDGAVVGLHGATAWSPRRPAAVLLHSAVAVLRDQRRGSAQRHRRRPATRSPPSRPQRRPRGGLDHASSGRERTGFQESRRLIPATGGAARVAGAHRNPAAPRRRAGERRPHSHLDGMHFPPGSTARGRTTAPASSTMTPTLATRRCSQGTDWSVEHCRVARDERRRARSVRHAV